MTDEVAFKGVVLAGGRGTRLYPSTVVACKQLLPVFDKPMIYYPISLLLLQRIRNILIITTPEDMAPMQRLLGTGERFGANITFIAQEEPRGIAEGLILAEAYLEGSPFCFVLGDNILFGQTVPDDLARGRAMAAEGSATIYGYRVADPENFGVITFSADGSVLDVEEKPKAPKSNWASIGVYMFPGNAPSFARRVQPSARGELEIPEVHKQYRDLGLLSGVKLGRGTAWLDTGAPEALMEAGNFLHAIERRQGLKVYCPEEVAYRSGLLSREALAQIASAIPSPTYRGYLERVLLD